MSKTAYSPDTGELIVTNKPGAWMGLTDLVPPVFDRATQGCFFREGEWVIVDSDAPPTTIEIAAKKRKTEIKADLLAIDFRKIRPLAEGDAAYLDILNQQTRVLRDELRSLE